MRTCVSKAVFLALVIAASTNATAELIKRDMPACISEELLSELHTYVAKGDKSGLAQLVISGQCTMLQRGEQVSVIDPGFMKATVRYKGVKLYTPSEALR